MLNKTSKGQEFYEQLRRKNMRKKMNRTPRMSKFKKDPTISCNEDPSELPFSIERPNETNNQTQITPQKVEEEEVKSTLVQERRTKFAQDNNVSSSILKKSPEPQPSPKKGRKRKNKSRISYNYQKRVSLYYSQLNSDAEVLIWMLTSALC